MRRHVGNKPWVKAGNTVLIHCVIRKGQRQARLQVWSRTFGFEYSPHIQNHKLMLFEGKPAFVKPLYICLIPERAKHTFEFIADYDCQVCIMQDVDDDDEKLAKVKVKSYGKFALEIRRHLGNIFRFLRRSS